MAEGLDVDVAARSIEGDGCDLWPARLEKHPVSAGGCGACFQGGQHCTSKPTSPYAFPHEHAFNLCGPLGDAWYTGCAKSPATHRNRVLTEITDQEDTMRRSEFLSAERRLIWPAVDRDVELICSLRQRRHVRMLVRHLKQSKIRGHPPSVSRVLSPFRDPRHHGRLVG
jgi:hypothetical protein